MKLEDRQKKAQEISETLVEVLEKQITKSRKIEMIYKGSSKKEEGPYFTWKGKYDPWLLEVRHIAIHYGITVSQLERIILDLEDDEISDRWMDYKSFQKEAMMYDEMFGQIRPQLAEFSLKKFDKSETTKTDVIFKTPSADTIKLNVEISRLQKEIDYYKKGGK